MKPSFWQPASGFRALPVLFSISVLAVFIVFSLPACLVASKLSSPILARQTPNTPLEVFQVHQPVFTPQASSEEGFCVTTNVLMEHSFGFSFGRPFVGKLLMSLVITCRLLDS